MTAEDIPHFELQRVYDDGTAEEPEISPVLSVPGDTMTDRRGALGFGLVLGGGVAASTMMSTTGEAKVVKTQQLRAHTGYIEALKISPNGKILATKGAGEKVIRLWSLPDGKLLKTIKGHKSSPQFLGFSPDNRILVSGTPFENQLRLWSLPDGKPLAKLKGFSSYSQSVSFSPDNKILAANMGTNEVRLWSVTNGKLLAKLKGHTANVRRIGLSPDGRVLASVSDDLTIRLWSMPDGKALATLKGHSDKVIFFRFSPDGRYLVSSCRADETIHLWSVPDGKLMKTWKTQRKGSGLFNISPDSRQLAFNHKDYTTHLRSLPDGELLSKLKVGVGRLGGLKYSPDGDTLITVDGFWGTVQMWSVSNGKLIKKIKHKSRRRNFIYMSPNSQLMAIHSFQYQTLPLHSLEDGKLLTTLVGHEKYISRVAISPDSNILVSGDGGGTVILWQLPTGKKIATLFDPAVNSGKQKAVAFKQKDSTTGSWHTFTQPCGSPIPAGATCTCNCVAGTYKAPSSPKTYKRPAGKKYRKRTYCSCDKVCTCIPVCQAHKLLDQDPIVRSMAEQILLIMGPEEQDYMNWAANDADDKLKDAIIDLTKRIKEGESWNGKNWPSVKACCDYLNHEDEVISLMAAQMLSQWDVNDCANLDPSTEQKMQKLLARAPSMHWELRAS